MVCRLWGLRAWLLWAVWNNLQDLAICNHTHTPSHCHHPHMYTFISHTHTHTHTDHPPPNSTLPSAPQPAASDGLLPLPTPAQSANQMPIFEVPDLEQQMKMLQLQQEMTAAHPELLNYQAAMQNPVLFQQMQFMWFQQQQVISDPFG